MKKYVYDNAIVYISSQINIQKIYNATENFLRKVEKEKRDAVKRNV